jgi:hypothetical protein
VFDAFAMPGKNVHPKFFFQFQYGFRDTGLRGVKGFGCFRQVQLAPYSLLDKSKLVQVHV